MSGKIRRDHDKKESRGDGQYGEEIGVETDECADSEEG